MSLCGSGCIECRYVEHVGLDIKDSLDSGSQVLRLNMGTVLGCLFVCLFVCLFLLAEGPRM